ncbi:MAG: hypothetical protein AB2375_05920 [Tissierellaceae bacterium]
MEDTLIEMCEDIIDILMLLREQDKITQSELEEHLGVKIKFLEDISK